MNVSTKVVSDPPNSYCYVLNLMVAIVDCWDLSSGDPDYMHAFNVNWKKKSQKR